MKSFLLIVALALTTTCIAQGNYLDVPPFPCDNYPCPEQEPFEPYYPTQPTEDVPIDGGLSILLAAGVCYGIKKVWNAERISKFYE